jgi:HlyD family secretion protein
MKSKTIWLVAILLIAGLTAIIVMARAGQTTSAAEWKASGFIEAEVVDLAPELAGRVTARPVSEGDEVQPGDTILQLADDVLLAQVEMARGKLAEAQAVLAQAQAGARPTTVAVATAQWQLAQASRDRAQQAWRSAQAIRDNPQTLDVQIAAAQAQVNTTQKQLEAALLQRDLAEQAWEDYGETSDKLADVPPAFRPHLPLDYYAIPYQWQQALAAAGVAQANHDAAVSVLKNLQAQHTDPQEAQVQVDAAYAAWQAAEAQVAQARAALDGLRAGATPDQIAAAQAQVDVAQAALTAAETQWRKSRVSAPAHGLIVATSIYTGELAAPGITAVQLADLDRVTLTIFVPGGKIGQFSIGQRIDVRVDAYLDRVFPGSISTISDQAEFTPRNVRTPDERAKLVYAVKIKLDNPDRVLKPGLQAEADVR